MEDILQRSSFYWNPHSMFSLKLISSSLLLDSFWYDLLVLKWLSVGGVHFFC